MSTTMRTTKTGSTTLSPGQAIFGKMHQQIGREVGEDREHNGEHVID